MKQRERMIELLEELVALVGDEPEGYDDALYQEGVKEGHRQGRAKTLLELQNPDSELSRWAHALGKARGEVADG